MLSFWRKVGSIEPGASIIKARLPLFVSAAHYEIFMVLSQHLLRIYVSMNNVPCLLFLSLASVHNISLCLILVLKRAFGHNIIVS